MLPGKTSLLKPLLTSAAVISRSGLASNVSGAKYCLDLVKRRDYDRFLANLLLPDPKTRAAAFAVSAFNVEVASVRDQVTDKTIGLMRLQFWRDTVESLYHKPETELQQPVARELRNAVREFDLSKELLQRIITSRERSLTDRPFDSLEDAEKYAHDAFTSVNYLLLETLTKKTTKDDSESNKLEGHARHAANQLGLAQGLTTLLRAVPYNASKRRVYLPTDLLMTHNVSQEDIVRKGQDCEGLKLVVEAVAERAQEHLDNCRFRGKFLGDARDVKLLLLPAISVDGFLNSLHKANCNVFDGKLQAKNSWLPMLYSYHKFRGSY